MIQIDEAKIQKVVRFNIETLKYVGLCMCMYLICSKNIIIIQNM